MSHESPTDRPATFRETAFLGTGLALTLSILTGCSCSKPSESGPSTAQTTPPATTAAPLPPAPAGGAPATSVTPAPVVGGVPATDTPAPCEMAAVRTGHKRDLKGLQNRIIGGHPSEGANRPWMAAISADGKSQFCGGALIAKDWVLTAAHCGVTQSDKVILGRSDLTTTKGKVVTVTEVKTHAKYNADTHDFDVSLVHVKDAPADLPVLELYDGSDSLATQQAIVVGWGYTKEGGPVSPKLLEVEVPIVSNDVCLAGYKPDSVGITGNMLCAGKKEGGKDSCQGDSGGPLIVQSGNKVVQAGIVSFGIGCARPDRYGVYTRISEFRPWIRACSK